MSAVLVDSNILIDVIARDEIWFARSSKVLAETAEMSRLVINPIIYAEVSVLYSTATDFDAAFAKTMIVRESLPYEAAFLAGKAFLAYRQRGGAKLSPLPDFFIGAHALVAGYDLMTRDTARFRTYFPNVRLIVP